MFERIAQFLLAASFSFPFVSAQMSGNLPQFLERGFSGIFNALGRDSIRSGLTFTLFLVTIYAILLAAAKRVKIFQGDENTVNKSGKIVAFTISAMSTVGLFFTMGRSFYETAALVLQTVNVFGMVLFGLVIGLITYFGFKQNDDRYPCAAVASAGLAIIIPSQIMQWQGWYTFGLILLIIGGIWCLFKLFKGNSSGGSDRGGDGGRNSGGSDRGREDGRDRGNNDRDEEDKEGNVNVFVSEIDNRTPIPNARVYIMYRGNALNPRSWKFWNWELGRSSSRWRFVGETDNEGRMSFSAYKGRRSIRVLGPERSPPEYETHTDVYRVFEGQDNNIHVRLTRVGGGTSVNIEITADNVNLPADGITNTILRIRTTRAGGAMIPNQWFNIEGEGIATLNPAEGVHQTDQNGTAEFIVTSPNAPGRETFTANLRPEDGGSADNVTLVYGGGGVNGQISGIVRNSVTGNIIVGVTVSWGGLTDVTDATGNYTINVPVLNYGNHHVTAVRGGYTNYDSGADITVNNANPTPVHNFAMNPAGVIDGHITGTVRNPDTGNGEDGVRVMWNGRENFTNGAGHYDIVVPPGSYGGPHQLTAEKAGFDLYNGPNFTINAGNLNENHDFDINPAGGGGGPGVITVQYKYPPPVGIRVNPIIGVPVTVILTSTIPYTLAAGDYVVFIDAAGNEIGARIYVVAVMQTLPTTYEVPMQAPIDPNIVGVRAHLS